MSQYHNNTINVYLIFFSRGEGLQMNPKSYFLRGGIIPPPCGDVGELHCGSPLTTSAEPRFPGDIFQSNTAQLTRLVFVLVRFCC